MIIRQVAYPRIGLIGNPSDGYFGKTIAVTFGNFHAEVVLYESPELVIEPSTRDHSCFKNIASLVQDVRLFGYYGGIRLLKATVKLFSDYCAEQGFSIPDRNCAIRYKSDIPHLVGLAGSSAIIVACLRALMSFYEVDIPKPRQANMVLAVEKDELGISAGLQDRVAQVYQGLVYMDFDRAIMEKQGCGAYEEMSPGLLPPLYVAYRADMSQESGIVHKSLRERYDSKNPEFLAAIREWMELTDRAKIALEQGRRAELGDLLNANFDLRARVCGVGEANMELVRTARSVGASAKFTGSGGAVVGTYDGEDMFRRLTAALAPLNVEVIKPEIVSAE